MYLALFTGGTRVYTQVTSYDVVLSPEFDTKDITYKVYSNLSCFVGQHKTGELQIAALGNLSGYYLTSSLVKISIS